jgi:2-keto-3-deoxy-6-phosphogluconate aldolase
MTELTSRLANAPVVPLVQADCPDTAVAITKALAEGGLTGQLWIVCRQYAR